MPTAHSAPTSQVTARRYCGPGAFPGTGDDPDSAMAGAGRFLC